MTTLHWSYFDSHDCSFRNITGSEIAGSLNFLAFGNSIVLNLSLRTCFKFNCVLPFVNIKAVKHQRLKNNIQFTQVLCLINAAQ